MTTSPPAGPEPPAQSGRPATAEETSRLVAERYGAPRHAHRWLLVCGVAAVAAAGLAWLAWAGLSADPDVDAEVVSFVATAHAVDAEVAIHRDGEDAVTCTLVAQATGGSVVGETELTLAEGSPGEHLVQWTVVTERPASTVRVTNCR
jgi:hypothetical protein